MFVKIFLNSFIFTKISMNTRRYHGNKKKSTGMLNGYYVGNEQTHDNYLYG